MSQTPNDELDVCVVGAGIAGTSCANALARRGVKVALVEAVHPMKPCFKAEQISGQCVDLLRRAGYDDLSPAAQPVAWTGSWFRERWLGAARLGPADVAFAYADLINLLRGRLDASVITSWNDGVASVEPTERGATVVTRSGRRHRARLVVVATGDSRALLEAAGVRDFTARRPERVSVVGWSMAGSLPVVKGERLERATFHRPSAGGFAYLTLFRHDGGVRANLLCPGGLDAALQERLTSDPLETCRRISPAFRRMSSGWSTSSKVALRPARTGRIGVEPRGAIVAIGDTAHVLDPTGGEGARLALEEMWLLVDTYVPRWLASPEPIAPGEFTADPGLSRLEARLARADAAIEVLYNGHDLRSLRYQTEFVAKHVKDGLRTAWADLGAPLQRAPWMRTIVASFRSR